MKNMTYKQFVKLRCSDESGNLIKLSQFKKENPDAFNSFNASFDFAYSQIIRDSNLHCAKTDGGRLITEKTIMANSRVKEPDKTYEEMMGRKS